MVPGQENGEPDDRGVAEASRRDARTMLAPDPTSTNVGVEVGTPGTNGVPRLRTLLGVVTASQYGLAIFEGTFVLYARDHLSLSAEQTSVAFVACGVVMASQVPRRP